MATRVDTNPLATSPQRHGSHSKRWCMARRHDGYPARASSTMTTWLAATILNLPPRPQTRLRTAFGSSLVRSTSLRTKRFGSAHTEHSPTPLLLTKSTNEDLECQLGWRKGL